MGRKAAIGIVGAALAASAGAAGASAGAAAPGGGPGSATQRAIVTVSTPDLPVGDSPSARSRWHDIRADAGRVLGAVASAGGLDVEARIPEIGQLAIGLGGESVGDLRERLGDDPRVLSVRPDRPAQLRYQPNDSGLAIADANAPFGDVVNWNLIRSGALGAWDISKGGGAEVAVIDSGADISHPDLAGRVAGTLDCTPDCGSGSVEDTDGHGTHVSGLACGDTDNGYGIASLGFDCDLWIAKISLCSSVAQAIVHAANRSADAINLSIGDCDSSLLPAIDYAWARGSVPVAAGTNTPTPGGPNYPAQRVQPEGSGPNLDAGRGLVVTAAKYTGERADFAQSTTGVSVAAFGASSGSIGGRQGILSTWPQNPPSIETGSVIPPRPGCNCRTNLGGDNRFAYLVGTSMATPQVAGLVALMRAANPALPAPQLVRLVKLTAGNCATYRNGTGWGLINAERAVAAAAGRDLDPPSSSVERATRKKIILDRSDPVTCSTELPRSGVQKVIVFASSDGRRYRQIGSTAKKSLKLGRKGRKGFRPKQGRRYRFFSVAVDVAGNREQAPAEPDASRKFKKKKGKGKGKGKKRR